MRYQIMDCRWPTCYALLLKIESKFVIIFAHDLRASWRNGNTEVESVIIIIELRAVQY